jgi:hypothetical protein
VVLMVPVAIFVQRSAGPVPLQFSDQGEGQRPGDHGAGCRCPARRDEVSQSRQAAPREGLDPW